MGKDELEEKANKEILQFTSRKTVSFSVFSRVPSFRPFHYPLISPMGPLNRASDEEESSARQLLISTT